jgi:hypothetical protein
VIIHRTTVRAQWKIEVQASTYPVEEWMPLRDANGKRFEYLERTEADAQIVKLLRFQPQAIFRVSPL